MFSSQSHSVGLINQTATVNYDHPRYFVINTNKSVYLTCLYKCALIKCPKGPSNIHKVQNIPIKCGVFMLQMLHNMAG